MPTISITAQDFKGPYINRNGVRQPNISRKKCLKYAMTVGNAHYTPTFGRTATALALASYRAMAMRCVIDFNQLTLQPHLQYAQLEATEKLNLSYWIGMTFAAIAAAEVLQVIRLIHASRQHGLVKVNPRSKSLADLVGRDRQRRWHVIEAKGRQRLPTDADREAWKTQAQTVGSINGAAIATSSYCVGRLSSPCSIELIDPQPSRQNPIDLNIDSREIELGYYEPYADFLRSDVRRVSRNNRTFFVRPIAFDPVSNDSVYVGLEDHYYVATQAKSQMPWSVDEYEDESLYVATDGVVIVTSSGPCDP